MAETFISHGRKPQVISTDMHQMSVYGPMFNLPTTMSKMLHCGMSLEEVVAATTCNPARVLGRESEMGMLAVGRKADIAVFEFADGPFRLFDSQHNVRSVERVLTNVATIKDGRLLPRAEATPPPGWIPLTEPQQALANMDPQPRNVLSAGPFDSPQAFLPPPRTEWSA